MKTVDTGSESWNVAQGYTQLKVLHPLVEIDKLIKISIYGCENIEMSLEIPDQMKIFMRLEAIKRLVDDLKLIIENTIFVMGKDTNQITELAFRIANVAEMIGPIQYRQVDQRTNESSIRINEEHFNLVLSELRDIKTLLNYPLNKHNLIFPGSDEIDLEKMKEELIHGG